MSGTEQISTFVQEYASLTGPYCLATFGVTLQRVHQDLLVAVKNAGVIPLWDTYDVDISRITEDNPHHPDATHKVVATISGWRNIT